MSFMCINLDNFQCLILDGNIGKFWTLVHACAVIDKYWRHLSARTCEAWLGEN